MLVLRYVRNLMTIENTAAKQPTIYDVAVAAGVSKSLVSLVLNGGGNVSAAKKEAVLKAIEERNPKEHVSGSALSWLDDLRRVSVAVAKKKARPASARQQLFYILKWTADKRQFGIEIRKGKYPENAEEWWKVDRALITPPQFVNEEDLGILRLIWADRTHETGLRAFGLGPKNGAEILQRMAASHRLYPEDDLGLPLNAGPTRPASIGWQVDGMGFQRPHLKPEPSAEMIIAVAPPWYVDLAEGEAGPLDVTGNPDVINRLFSLPPLSAMEAALVAEALSELAPDLPLPGSDAGARLRLVNSPLLPILQLETLHTHGHRAWRGYPQNFGGGPFDVAKVVFRYGDAEVRPEEKSEFITLPEGETIRLARRPDDEAKALLALFGVPVVPTVTAATPAEVEAACAAFAAPYAVKIVSPDLTHKSDIGGVALGLADAAAARCAAQSMLDKIGAAHPQARLQGFSVQPMIRRKQAHELFAGIAHDPAFGPLLMVGAGGTAVEVLADRAMRLPPIGPQDAAAMLAQTRISRLLNGYRDVPAADTGAICEVLMALSALIGALPQVAELDVNPLLADSAGVIALDARVVLAPIEAG